MPVFHPGINHGHSPSGRWSDVQTNPNSSFELNFLCPKMTPRQLVSVAIIAKFSDKPIALAHLNWYLTRGRGGDFSEDANLRGLLTGDSGVQEAIRRLLPPGRTSGIFTTHLKIEQNDYSNQDLRFAFGAIDQLDVEVDFGARTVHAWFQDRYEWHPFYPGLYAAFPDDGARETNCVHAALVELKSDGAADFWMKGEATAPLSVIVSRASTVPSSWSDL